MNKRGMWAASLAAMFVSGALTGFVLSGGNVRAEQKFGPEDVKSVPEEFVLGGNKQFAILRDLLTATLENQKRLDAIERNTAAMVNLLQRTSPSAAPPAPRTAPQRPQSDPQ